VNICDAKTITNLLCETGKNTKPSIGRRQKRELRGSWNYPQSMAMDVQK
jgi:hypothetical protein